MSKEELVTHQPPNYTYVTIKTTSVACKLRNALYITELVSCAQANSI